MHSVQSPPEREAEAGQASFCCIFYSCASQKDNMKVTLYLGFTFFCSIWSPGHFLQCYFCRVSKSFEDCQSQHTLDNCSYASDASDVRVCFQTSVKYDNGSYKREEFDTGCLDKSECDKYKKGDIEYCNNLRTSGFTVECVTECCNEDGCNKENLVVKSKGSSLVTSVVILLPGLLLALVIIC